MEQLSSETAQEIRAALRSGNKLEAVKIYKLATGSSLLDSKTAVEAMMKGESHSPASLAGGDSLDQILDAIFENRKLKAVKLHREASGTSLTESRRFIEQLTAQLREESPGQFRQSEFGCAGAVLLCLSLVVTAFSLRAI